MPRKWISENDAMKMFCPFRVKKCFYGDSESNEMEIETCEADYCMAWAWKDEKEDLGACLLIPPMED